MKWTCFGFAAISAALSGCVAPETLYRADPMSDSNTVWYSGRQFQTVDVDSITVSVAFENEINGTSTFYMVVGNMGRSPVLVAPERFYCFGSYKKASYYYDYKRSETEFQYTDNSDTLRALDPEIQLQGLDRQAAQANAAYATNTGINAAAALLQLVGDVATIGQPKSREQREDEEHQRRYVERSQDQNAADYQGKLNDLNDQRDYWTNAVLRKTTLFPNTAIGGRVAFPIDANLREFKMFIPIDTTVIEFDFRQSPLPGQ